MRTITPIQFLEYLQNSWLAGMDMNEVCFQLIVFHDIEITPEMEQKLGVFYYEREKTFSTFCFNSELKGH